MQHRALNELLCAAMINQNFRETLLADPYLALCEGYGGQPFNLSHVEFDLVVKIRADSLEDFASIVTDWMDLEETFHQSPSQTPIRHQLQWVDRFAVQEGEPWYLPCTLVASEQVA